MKTVRKTLAWIVLAACIAGCASPPSPNDYRQDTTPEHDGEHWIGGE